ncbi:MAG: zf-HC2 domain-containing protein [Chloroflexota bacterium]
MVGRNNSANSHAWVEARLSEYLDNRLAANEYARIEQHLRECAECRASFESLRWTIALVKQAPAPALPRAFTLPLPEVTKRAARPSLAFGFAQFATVLATLLLIAVIGVDLISQFGGGMTTTAPSVAKQYAAPTSAARDQAAEAAQPAQAPKPAEPTKLAAPKPTMAPTAAPQPTMAPTTAAQPAAAPPAAALPAPMNVLPTPTAPRLVGGGAPEVTETKGATDTTTAKSSSATPVFRAGFAITATATLPAPTATAMSVPPTATSVPPTATAFPSRTIVAQTRAEATRAPAPTQVPPATMRPFVTPLRVVEFGLLILAIFFGAVVIVMWRRK